MGRVTVVCALISMVERNIQQVSTFCKGYTSRGAIREDTRMPPLERCVCVTVNSRYYLLPGSCILDE